MAQQLFVVPVETANVVSPVRDHLTHLDVGLADAKETVAQGDGVAIAQQDPALFITSPIVGEDVPDPVIDVIEVGGTAEQVPWHISQNLTDRWGDINYYSAASKPLGPLLTNPALLKRLRKQMWDEIAFVVRKDGQYGILFEVEYSSIESDAEEATKQGDSDFVAQLKPHAEVVEALRKGMEPLREAFPGVQFAIPDKEQIVNDRPAAWAFFPDELLSRKQRISLGRALLSL